MTTPRVPLVVELSDGGGKVDSDLLKDGVGKTMMTAAVQAILDKADAYPAAGDTANHGRFLSFDEEGNPMAAAAPSGSGGQTAPQVLAAIRREIPAWSGQPTAADEMAADKMPDILQRLIRAFGAGGPRPYPNANIQIGGAIKDSSYSPAEARAIAEDDWGNSVTHASATAVSPNAYCAMRFAKSEYAARPTAMPTGVVMRVAPDLPEITPVLAALTAADTATHWVFSVTWGPQPADDQTVVLEIVEPATINLLPPAGSIRPSLLDGLTDAPAGDVITRGPDDTFGHHAASARRELYNGTQGITVVNATRRSALSPTAFDNALNRETAGDVGLVFVTSRRRLVTRSSTSISYAPDSVVTEAYASGFVDLATLGSYPVYNGTTAIGDTVVAIPVYLAPAGTLLGHELVNIAADATSEDYESIAVFEPSAAHTQSTMTWSSSGDTKIDFDDFGASVPGGGAGGQVRVYAAALPAAAGVPDNTVGIVINPASVAVKQTNITQGSQDTGWAGKTVDPHDLATARVGPYTLRYAASAGFQFTRNAHTASVAAGGAAAVSGGLPANGRLVWSYETAGNGSSLLECDYGADRTATGPIVFSVGSDIVHTYRLARANARAWDSGLLGVSDRAVLLSGLWRATEPEGTGHVATELWVPVNLGGGATGPQWVDLLDYQPASGEALTRRQLVELPAGQDFNPALTSAHDNWSLDIEIQVSNTATGAGRIWSIAESIRCQDWRLAGNSPAGAHFGNAAADGVWTAGVFMSSNTSSTDSWGRFGLCKGPNGRPAIIWAGPTAYLRRLRARRHT